MTSQNSFGAAGKLKAGGKEYEIFRLAALEKAGIRVVERVPCLIEPSDSTELYLRTKKEKLGHLINLEPTRL